jgi:tetratricopeptide (TPR) repeat protein
MSTMGGWEFKSPAWAAPNAAIVCVVVCKSVIVGCARRICIGARSLRTLTLGGRWPAILWCAALLTVFACPQVQAVSSEELDDASARVEYAFYTSDARGLEAVLQMIERLEIDEPLVPMQHYYAAFGYWKLAQLYTEEAAGGREGARGLADRAGDACTEHAVSALQRDGKMFEAQALKAACSRYGFGARVSDLASAAGCSKHKSLRTAQAADPKNPRIKLIDAWCTAGKARTGSTAVLEKARAAVSAFEGEPFHMPGAPSWGEPEALVLLGQAYLERGEPVAARNLLEQALALAPDYRKARQLLEATSRAR